MTLADFVYADLGSKVSQTGQPPCGLGYAALCEHYGVSLTPVRTAVKRLLAEGYLAAEPNGRLSVAADPPEFDTATIPSGEQPLGSDAEDCVRNALIHESLLGKSDFVREEAAAARFGIGRTALRPILSRLAGAGILEHVPRCGWRVCSFDREDLSSFLDVRELLEVKALRLSYDQLEAAVLERFLAENRSGQVGETGDLTNNLHGYWVSLCGNRYIKDFFGQQSIHLRSLLDYAAPAADRIDEMAAQHCVILAALLEQDLPAAEAALISHIRAQEPIMLSVMDELRGGSISA